MTAQINQPVPDEEITGQEEDTSFQTYDDKLARDFYKDHSSEQEVFKQVIIALAFAGITYGKEVVNAYNLLKNPLDPKQLVENPAYKKRVERAVQLVKRHEGKRLGRGQSEYTTIIDQTTKVLTQVESAHVRLLDLKNNLAEDLYTPELQRLYGLDEKEMQSAVKIAQKRIQENPSLSMRDVLHQETQRASRQKTVKKIEREAKSKGERLTKKQKEERVATRFKDIEGEFDQRMALAIQHEDLRSGQLIDNGVSEVAQTLGLEPKPTITPTEISEVTPVAQPTQAPVQQPVQAPILTQPALSVPPPSAFPITRLRERIIVSPISANIGRLTSAVANIENRIRSFGADLLKGGFSKLIKSKFLTTAINTGLSILSGGTYKALQIAATAASYLLRLLGIDIDFGRLAIVGIASIVILVFAIPFFFLNFGLVGLSRVIPNYGVENAMKVAYDKQPVLSWREFEKRFLTINKNGEDGKVVSFNDWLIFEKEFLSFKNYTSP